MIGIGLRGQESPSPGGARSQGKGRNLRGLAPRTGSPLNCRTPPLLGANEHHRTAHPTPPLDTHLRRRLSRPPRLRAHPSPSQGPDRDPP